LQRTKLKVRSFDLLSATTQICFIAVSNTFTNGILTERHSVTDERKALQDVLAKLDNELHRLNPIATPTTDFVYLSGTTVPNLGDFNVYGVLRAIQNLPIYQEMILSNRSFKKDEADGSLVVRWLHHMSKHLSN
jgi:hypothetical protein